MRGARAKCERPAGQRLQRVPRTVSDRATAGRRCGNRGRRWSHDAASKSLWERMPIMRSDVKLGLAIGGVLLAVLIVYVLVVPGSEQGGTELATAEAGVETLAQNSNAGATTPQTGETSTASNSNSATEPQQQAEGST